MIWRQAKDALAAATVQRLDDHVLAQALHEGQHALRVGRYYGLGHEVGKTQDAQLLTYLAQARRIVEHEGARGVGQAEQLGGKEKVGVKGRVLAHEDRVEVAAALVGPRP